MNLLQKEAVTLLTKYVANRSSLKQLQHFAQIVQSGQFHQYDHGAADNFRFYGQEKPPNYDLNKVTAPVTVFYGTVDGLVPADGVQSLLTRLPNVKNAVELPWNHIDVVLGKDADVQVNDPIIRSMIDEAKSHE